MSAQDTHMNLVGHLEKSSLLAQAIFDEGENVQNGVMMHVGRSEFQ